MRARYVIAGTLFLFYEGKQIRRYLYVIDAFALRGRPMETGDEKGCFFLWERWVGIASVARDGC